MSRRIRRKPNMSKNQLKTVLIVLVIAVCLFVIYKFNFVTKSEVEITTPVKFKEFETKNEMTANIPLLEDEKGKYIILPEKVNGIFASAYYLSEENIEKNIDNTVAKNEDTEIEVKNTTVENNNTVGENTISNSVGETTTNTSITNENQTTTNSTNMNTIDTNAEPATVNEVESNPIIDEPKENIKNEAKDEENESKQDATSNENVQAQIDAINESLFDKATSNSEEYADKLEEIADNIVSNSTPENTTAEENAASTENVSPNPEQETINNEQTVSSENEEKVVPETGNKVIVEKPESLPGEKYYLSDEEIENENLAITVKYQTVEIKGKVLYNQEFSVDMIDTLVKLTCYTPLGYYLDVKEENVNNIQELKADVEKISNSETLFAYDIKIVNGEDEFQPEEYYQIATVSITKPESIDFKPNAHSLQLLHIKETEEEINFERIELSNIENDSFEFITNEFSVYAMIMFAADQGDSITINDYTNDKNYYLGKNYTSDMSGQNSGKYTEENLAQVNINYYSYDPDINLNNEETITINNVSWGFTGSGTTYNARVRFNSPSDSYIDTNKPWSLEIGVPTDLRSVFATSFDEAGTTSLNSSRGIEVTYNPTTYILKATGNNMNDWSTCDNSSINHTVGPYETNFSLSFASVANVDANLFIPTSKQFRGIKKILVGTTSSVNDNEKHVLYSYIKCIPIVDGKINLELIDNPFMNRPTGFGFNGWLSKDTNNIISTDKSSYLQTLQRTLNTTEIASKEITIDLYVDWKEANIIFVDANSGNNSNNGLTKNTAVQNWNGITSVVNQMKNGGRFTSATNASDRELTIIVLTGGELGQLSNNPGCAYTLTSLYDGVDYRAQSSLTVPSNSDNYTVINNDIQLDFITTNATATNSDNISFNDYYGISDRVNLPGRLSGNAYNLRIGRGVKSSSNNKITFAQVHGTNGGVNKNYRLVIESGYYKNIQVFAPNSGGTVTSNAILVLGSDLDRVNNNNNGLKVNHRVCSAADSSEIYAKDTKKPISTMIVKSGTFGLEAFNYYKYTSYYNNEDYAYTGIYAGGVSSDDGNYYGDRTLIVEGGEISNIVGGLKVTKYTTAKTYIYVKGGDIYNIVGGAGQSRTFGDRVIQVTDGLVEYGVSGGSNGVFSNWDNTGELIGNTLVYIGGNATIGAETPRFGNTLYDLNPGTVCGAGNGKESIETSGRVNTSHVIIDGNATINGSVYGGGNYGFVEKTELIPEGIEPTPEQEENIVLEECSFEELESNENYVITNNDNQILSFEPNNLLGPVMIFKDMPEKVKKEDSCIIELLEEKNFYIKYNIGGKTNYPIYSDRGGYNYGYLTNENIEAGAVPMKFTYTNEKQIIMNAMDGGTYPIYKFYYNNIYLATSDMYMLTRKS